MTETEKKALALVNKVNKTTHHCLDAAYPYQFVSALCRAIEQHEAFRQEVSDAVEAAKRTYGGHRQAFDQLERFIITKPDPLVEVIDDMNANPQPYVDSEHYSKRLRAALAARGLKIVEDKA